MLASTSRRAFIYYNSRLRAYMEEREKERTTLAIDEQREDITHTERGVKMLLKHHSAAASKRSSGQLLLLLFCNTDHKTSAASIKQATKFTRQPWISVQIVARREAHLVGFNILSLNFYIMHADFYSESRKGSGNKKAEIFKMEDKHSIIRALQYQFYKNQ